MEMVVITVMVMVMVRAPGRRSEASLLLASPSVLRSKDHPSSTAGEAEEGLKHTDTKTLEMDSISKPTALKKLSFDDHLHSDEGEYVTPLLTPINSLNMDLQLFKKYEGNVMPSPSPPSPSPSPSTVPNTTTVLDTWNAVIL